MIECGAQATGGNYAFFEEIPDLGKVGFPIAEVFADGSSVITKHPGSGGAVTTETVTAQLLYEIDGPRYFNPDVITRLDTVRLEQIGPDRVRIAGVRGEPAPEMVKVGALVEGGYRNAMTFVLTGSDIEAKADAALTTLWNAIPGGDKAFDTTDVRMLRADRPNPTTVNDAVALMTVTVTAADRRSTNAFSRAAVETALASYPGFHFTGPPGPSKPFTVFWPTLMPADDFHQRVTLGDRRWTVADRVSSTPGAAIVEPAAPSIEKPAGETIRGPIGLVLGARSGDKAGNATLGVWARNDAAYAWLVSWWNEHQLRTLIPEAAGLELRCWRLPLLRACGVTIVGLLGAGSAATPALDAQAKALGEYLRAKHMDIPIALVADPTTSG